MALTKAHNRLIDTKTVNIRDFGVVGDGVTNDAAAFRTCWQYLRDEWYDNGNVYTLLIDCPILIDSPTYDADYGDYRSTAFVLDFPCKIIGTRQNKITFQNTLGCALQLGVYSDGGLNKFNEIYGLHIDCVDKTPIAFRLAYRVQSNLIINDCYAERASTGFMVSGAQDIFPMNLKTLDCLVGCKIQTNTPGKVDGYDGSYTWNTTTWASTNLGFTGMTNHNNDNIGIWIDGGTQISFKDFVCQGGEHTTSPMYISGGGDILLENGWMEVSAGSTHNELFVDSTFSGNALFKNLKGASVGARADIDGGTITWLNSNTWLGVVDVVSPATCIMDKQGGASRLGSQLMFLDRGLPVTSASDTKTDAQPQNRFLFSKGSISTSSNVLIEQFGNNSTEDKSKGFFAVVNMYDATASLQCTVEVYANGGNGTTPTTAITDKLGTRASMSVSVDVTLAASSPNKVLKLVLTNSSANTVKYEVTWFPYEM